MNKKTPEKSKTAAVSARFALFCDYALLSQDGKLSLIGEFDHLFSSSDKAVLPRGFLVASLLGEPNTQITLSVRIINEEAKDELFNKELGLTTSSEGKINIIMGFEGLQFNKFGIYKAQILHQGIVVTGAMIHVLKMNPPSAATA